MTQDLTNGDISSHIKQIAIPASIGYFFHTMFNVTDTYFAGEISTTALSALTLSFSIFFMVIAIASGMANAVTSLVGNALGEKDSKKASNTGLNGLGFGVVLSLFLTSIGLFVTPYLMKYLGASGEYLEESLGYINIIIYGSVIFVLAFFTNAILQALGDTKSFRNALFVAAFLNIILDYWFVKGGLGISPMGVSGIALATIIIELFTLSYLLYRLHQKSFFQFDSFHVNFEIIKDIIKFGFPPSVNMVLMALGIYIITYYASPFGKEVVAAFGIGMRVEQIVLMPSIGLNVAVLSIVAQNSGAKNFARIEETVKKALKYGTIISIIGIVAILTLNDFMMSQFSSDPKVIAEGVKYLYVESLVIFPFMIIFIMLAMLTGIKKPKFILYISIFRQVIAPIALLSLLSYFGFGVLSIWLGIASIVILSSYISWVYSWRKLKELSL